MRLQAMALRRPAITPGGTTAPTSSPVTSKRVGQPGLTGGAMAKIARVGGVRRAVQLLQHTQRHLPAPLHTGTWRPCGVHVRQRWLRALHGAAGEPLASSG